MEPITKSDALWHFSIPRVGFAVFPSDYK